MDLNSDAQSATRVREGVKKTRFSQDFVPNYGQVGVQSPKLFSENNQNKKKHLGLCPKIGVAVGGWGSRVPNKYIEFCPKNLSLFQKKKQNNLNSPKSKINLTSTFHLVESQACAVGGWGPTFGTKSPKKGVLFLDTFPKSSPLSKYLLMSIKFKLL